MRTHALTLALFSLMIGFIAPRQTLAEDDVAAADSDRSVAFSNHNLTYTATVGDQFQIASLTALLSNTGSGNLQWTAPQAPSWLTLSNTAPGSLTGTPTTAGSVTFTLFVSEVGSGGETGNDSAQITITTVTPIVWSGTVNLGTLTQGTAMTPVNLATLITTPAGGAGLTFSATGLPSWMSLTPAGVLTGTPGASNVGAITGITFIATASSGNSAQTGATGQVLPIPPTWVSNPIDLPSDPVGTAYTQNVVQYILNPPAGGSLSFSIISAPSWVKVDSLGNLYGTPTASNVGTNNITLMFTDLVNGTSYSGTTTFVMSVTPVNLPPVWAANPITLPTASSRQPYSQNLANSVTDPNTGDTLTFTIVSGPSWATISSTGVISGTPPDSAAGQNSFVVQATTQAGLSAQTTVIIPVVVSPYAPNWIAKPTILPNATQGSSYTANLNSYVNNPSNLPLTFTVLSGPSWATVSTSGILTGTPLAANLPLSTFSIQVANSVGNDVTNVMVSITAVYYPPVWLLNPIVLTVQQNSPVNISIAGYVTDPNPGQTVSFQLVSGPAWASLSAAGTFTGTPLLANVGTNTYTVTASDATGKSSNATVIINVIHVNVPPVWSQNPITLANAPEQTAYTASVASYASDPDGDAMTFSLVSGPSWVTVAANGTISGTPPASAIGLNTLQVMVTDTSNEFAVTTVQITVTKVNHPPIWLQNPITMTNAYDNQPYSFNLAPYATDPDGNPMTFSLVSGPSWMTVSPAGIVSGSPTVANDGAFTATFAVSDVNFTVNTVGNGTVVHVPQPPVIAAIPTITMKERQVLQVTLSQYVTDPDTTALTYTMANAPSWVTFFSNGNLTLSPLHPQVGTQTLTFTVAPTDNPTLTATGTLTVIVQADPRPPVWLVDPITMAAKSGIPFTGTLSGQSKDLDGLAVTYSKVSGNAWLTVAADGTLSGTPTTADIGTDTFTVQSCNTANLCSTDTLIITVTPGIQTDTTQIDQPVPGAPAENLWVIDSSRHCNRLIAALKKNIGYYFDLLTKAQLHFTGVYLSSNAYKWDGQPIASQSGSKLLTWNESDITEDFNERIKLSNRSEETEKCHNCLNSPIWSMFRFYEQLPGMSDIYQMNYFMPNVPMDAMIITQQRDHYGWYSSKTEQKNWAPSDYAASFIETHTKLNKPYRISAIAPKCPRLVSEMPNDAAPENAYRTLTSKTNGTYYTPGNCGYDLHKYLEDYANKVIFRAYVYGKTSFPLSKKPIDPSTITVSIGGVQLQSTQWSYNPSLGANGSVVINWSTIDFGSLKPGDDVSISYQVS